MLNQLGRALHLSAGAKTALTTDPVLCIGLVAPAAPLLARRVGLRGVMAAVLEALVGGLGLRLGPSPLTLFAGTTIAGGAIAFGNVLLSALVKSDFPGEPASSLGSTSLRKALRLPLRRGSPSPRAQLLV